MANLLIVDENLNHSSSLVALLGNGGHELRQATDGTQALSLIARERPDIVITDILMSGMDGYELVLRLRAVPEVADTPVIFCTPASRENDARAVAKICGVDHVLVNPWDLQHLNEAIDSCLHKGVLPTPPAVADDLDGEYLRLLMNELTGQTEKSTAASQRAESLLKVSLQLASLMESDALIKEFCKSARQLVGAKYAVAGLEPSERKANHRLVIAGVEWDCADRVGNTETVHSAVSALLNDRHSVCLRNPPGDPLALRFPSDYPSFFSLLAVPIVSPQRTYGWLCLFHKLGAVEFNEEDQRLAEILGGLAGRIYESGRMHAVAQEHSRQLEQELAERKRAEEQLRTAKETAEASGRSAREATDRLSLALSASQTGVWSWDVINDVMVWDEFIHQMFGLPAESFGGTFSDLLGAVHPDDRDELTKSVIGSRQVTEQIAVEFRVVWPDGSLHNIESRGQAFYDAAGRMVRRTGVARDITEQRTLEEQLRQAHKMDAIGQLAGGIAHDFNNVLTVISGFSGLILDNLASDHPFHAKVEQIRKAGDRGAALTRQLLAFSRKQMLQPRVVNFGDLIHDMDHMVQRVIDADIEIVTSIEDDIARIKIDPGQLHQVVLNLVINARDAMPKGGKLTLAAKNVTIDRTDSQEIPPGSYVQLTVSDNGIGMTQEVRKRAFEPFFTTKEIGKGTGLGLATVYGIVKQSGGHITLESELGNGTTFTIFFPRVDERPDPPEENVLPQTPGGDETILLVEDDTTLRIVIQEILGSVGYKVLIAENGEEALRISEHYEHKIDLLLTDVIMPKLGGVEVANRISGSRPGIKVLFTSGYSGGAINRLNLEDTDLILKPWTPEELTAKIRLVLNRRPPIRHILVVEDEDGVRNWLVELLQGAGYTVTPARQGREARLKIKEQQFDLLITDLVMPEEDGLELIRAIRGNHPDIKIVAISGAFGNRMLRVAKLFGCQEILAKPLTAERLLESIRSLVEHP
jgi:PAS domain S-box-containing protein